MQFLNPFPPAPVVAPESQWKPSVKVATTTSGTLASSFASSQTVDDVTLVTGDRILIKNQSAASENGIYTVNASGAPTRATDSDTGAELLAATVQVEEGTVNADTVWYNTANAPITIGSTLLVFNRLGTPYTSPWKASVRVATTNQDLYLPNFKSGWTLDGITLATGDRVLVKDQFNQAENGIYVVDAVAAPVRANDANTGLLMLGASCVVEAGTLNADTIWMCTANAQIGIGSTSLPFLQIGKSYTSPWKASVKVATTTSGTLASSFASSQTVDGVTLATGDRILIKNQAASAENGVYTVNASGTPTRAADAATSALLLSAVVPVERGTVNSLTTWLCTDSTMKTFVKQGSDPSFVTYTNTVADLAEVSSLSPSYDGVMFLVSDPDGKSFQGFTTYASNTITVLSDPNSVALTTDSGVGYYVRKTATSRAITIKNRSGSTKNITIKFYT